MFSSVEGCRSFWKTFQRRAPKADPWGHPLAVAYQSLVVSWLILILFFLFVKYDRIRASESLEKQYALSLLISRGACSETNTLDISVDKTPTTFLLSTAYFHLSTNPIREVSQLWFLRYAVRLLLNIGLITDVSCLLSNCSKTFPITVKTMLNLFWPLPIVNLRIPGLIWRGTAYFVQNNTTIILPGDTRRTTSELPCRTPETIFCPKS